MESSADGGGGGGVGRSGTDATYPRAFRVHALEVDRAGRRGTPRVRRPRSPAETAVGLLAEPAAQGRRSGPSRPPTSGVATARARRERLRPRAHRPRASLRVSPRPQGDRPAAPQPPAPALAPAAPAPRPAPPGPGPAPPPPPPPTARAPGVHLRPRPRARPGRRLCATTGGAPAAPKLPR